MISGRNQVNEPHDDDRTSLMAELDIFNDKIMQVDMQGNQELVSKINQLLRNILLHKPQLLEGVLIQIMKHLYDYIFNNDPSLLERRWAANEPQCGLHFNPRWCVLYQFFPQMSTSEKGLPTATFSKEQNIILESKLDSSKLIADQHPTEL